MTATEKIILALLMLTAAGTWVTLRLIGTGTIGTGKGQHKLPRGWAEASERLATTDELILPAPVIPRMPTEHAPPWDDQPPPDAYFIAAGTVEGGRVTSVAAAVVPALPDYVLAAIGHGGDSEACVESMWNRVQARQLRELLRAEEAEEALS